MPKQWRTPTSRMFEIIDNILKPLQEKYCHISDTYCNETTKYQSSTAKQSISDCKCVRIIHINTITLRRSLSPKLHPYLQQLPIWNLRLSTDTWNKYVQQNVTGIHYEFFGQTWKEFLKNTSETKRYTNTVTWHMMPSCQTWTKTFSA